MPILSSAIEKSVLRELTLPTTLMQCGSTREFWTSTCNLITNFVGLEGQAVELVARTILCSALIEALPIAPALIIAGPDYARGRRLFDLLACTCRHPLRLTGVTVAGLCSLGGGARFTYLISQSVVDDALQKLLDVASIRDKKIPFRGGLLDLFGVQVIHSDSPLAPDSARSRSIQVETLPLDHALPAFDSETQAKITHEIQAKLLKFRCQKLEVARKLTFDASRIADELQDLATSLARGRRMTGITGARFCLLRVEDDEVRSSKSTEMNAGHCDAILAAEAKAPGENIYIADLAKIAQEILRERGREDVDVTPATLGKGLSQLGFLATRDAGGKRLLLAGAIVSRARELVHNFKGAESSQPPSDAAAPQPPSDAAAPQPPSDAAAPQPPRMPQRHSPAMPQRPVMPQRPSLPVMPQRRSLPVMPQRHSLPVMPQRHGLPVMPQRHSLPVMPQRRSLPVMRQRQLTHRAMQAVQAV